MPNLKEMIILRTNLKRFFTENPLAGYPTLIRTVDWCLANKRRPYAAWSVTKYVSSARAKGFLPELDPSSDRTVISPNVELGITSALSTERDPEWRQMLQNSQGASRAVVLASWQASHVA